MQDDYTQQAFEGVRSNRKIRRYGGVPDGFSRCSQCRQIKPLSDFYFSSNKYRKVNTYCIPCYAARRSERYHGIASVKAGRMNSELKRKYGITLQQRDAMLTTQAGKCAICESVLQTSVGTNIDHNHTTGKVRGILCTRCNSALAILDDRDWYERALRYLERFNK